jgi:hypothetical protein
MKHNKGITCSEEGISMQIYDIYLSTTPFSANQSLMIYFILSTEYFTIRYVSPEKLHHNRSDKIMQGVTP